MDNIGHGAELCILRSVMLYFEELFNFLAVYHFVNYFNNKHCNLIKVIFIIEANTSSLSCGDGFPESLHFSDKEPR